jgi:hypothetical protein
LVEEWGSFFYQPVSKEMEITMTQQDSDFPNELAAPARRALVGAGYVRLEQLTTLSEAEVKQLHGIGPNGDFVANGQ